MPRKIRGRFCPNCGKKIVRAIPRDRYIFPRCYHCGEGAFGDDFCRRCGRNQKEAFVTATPHDLFF